MISGSALERVDACPVSEKLPHRDEVASQWARRGTILHRYLEQIPELGQEEALANVPEEFRESCEALEIDKLPATEPGAYAVEVAFALDVDLGDAREIGRGIDREYGELHPREIPMTLDVVGLASDGETVIVHDYKSGWADVPAADRNWQLRAGALAAARAYGRKRAVVSVIRLRSDGSVWYDRATFDEFDLAVVHDDLRRLMDRVESADDTTTPVRGDHCRYCPAFHSCPANVQLAASLATPDAALDAFRAMLTPEAAADAWFKLKAARRVLEEMDEAVRAFAVQCGGIDLGNGKRLAPVERSRDYIDGGRALPILMAEFGNDAANEACEIKTSKTAIERVVGEIAKAKGEKMAPHRRAFLNKLRESGAIRTSTSTTVTETKAS